MDEFRVGVGLSRERDSEAAARVATRAAMAQAGLSQAAWALCFFSAHHMQGAENLRAAILGEAGCRALCGCSTMGVICGGEEVEGKPGVAVLVGAGGGMEAESVLLPEDGEGLAAFRRRGARAGGRAVLVALPDALSVDINRVRDRMDQELEGATLFGAGATDDGSVGISLQLGMEGVRNRSIALLGLFGDFEVEVGITQSCTTVGEPHFITAARGNILIELDGRPALQTMIELGKELELEDFQQLATQVMFGFPLDVENPEFTGETCLVRALGGLDQESHGLVMPFPLRNQTSMSFMLRNPGKAREDMSRMVERLGRNTTGPPDFGIYFDCAARGSGLYGRTGVDSAIIGGRFGDLPVSGMFGGYELATALGLPNVYTYTGVLLLVRGASRD